MGRTRGFAFAFLALVACGGAERDPKASRRAALLNDKDPSSSEWHYVTRKTQGGRDAECLAVLETLRGEAKCRQALCKPAVRLAEDWTTLCASRLKATAPEVRELEAKFRAELRPAEDDCETEFEDLLSSSCTPSDDCLGGATQWTRKCGSEYATPLALTILSVRAERTAGGPVVLDPRSCDQFLGELVKGLHCNNLPACEEGLVPVAAYREGCAPKGDPMPLSDALVILAVHAAAQTAAEPIPLSDVTLKPDVPFAVFRDGQGAVLRVGWAHPTSFETYAEAVAADDGADVRLARVFRSAEGKSELRLGTLTAAEGRTLGERFAPLQVRGEAEDLHATAASVMQAKVAQASEASSPREVAARLLEGLGALADSPVLPESARASLRASDGTLRGMCRWLADEKSRLLSKLGDRRALVAATRRADLMPFADVSATGDVTLGSVSLGAIHDAQADMPQCVSAYLEGLAFLKSKVRTITLSKMDEDKIAAEADAKTASLTTTGKQLAETEQRLLDCAFGVRQCSEEETDALAQEHGQAALADRRARVEARIAAATRPH